MTQTASQALAMIAAVAAAAIGSRAQLRRHIGKAFPARPAKRSKVPRNAPCPCGATKVVKTIRPISPGLQVPFDAGNEYREDEHRAHVVTRRTVPVKHKHCHGRARLTSIDQRKALAHGAFPNHFGNYLGKRGVAFAL